MLGKAVRFFILGPKIEWYISLLKRRKHTLLTKIIHAYVEAKLQSKFSSNVSNKAIIGRNVDIKHPIGLVIGDGVVIGDNITLYQNVTIGARRLGEGKLNLYPKIGHNVTIYSGAIILGGIEVGDNSIIGANSVVTKSVPANSIIVGAPGAVVGKVI